MTTLQQAGAATEAAILNRLDAQEARDDAKAEFISRYVSDNREVFASDPDLIDEAISGTSPELMDRLFESMVPLSMRGDGNPAQAVIDDILDNHLAWLAEAEWNRRHG